MLFALGLAGFLGLTGLAIDGGQIVFARTDLQKVADAAALAGAQDLARVAPSHVAAKGNAQAYASDNGAGTTTVVISQTDRPSDTITVTVTRTVEYTFLKALGMSSTDVSATAVVVVKPVTGFDIDEVDVFGYPIWGGNGDGLRGCKYDICEGDLKIYRFNPHYCASPDVTLGAANCTSPNFKGYFHDGGSTTQTSISPASWQTFSKGGNAVGQQPIAALSAKYAANEPVILPVITAANCSGGCSNIDFKIVGFIALELTVDPGAVNANTPLIGRVVGEWSTPKGSTNGSSVPPSNFPTVFTYGLTQ